MLFLPGFGVSNVKDQNALSFFFSPPKIDASGSLI
jgi:hypothetical protein